jgi:hypothetical protein
MLEFLIVALLVIWLFGFLVVHIAGPLIHLLLLFALIGLVIRLFRGKPASV